MTDAEKLALKMIEDTARKMFEVCVLAYHEYDDDEITVDGAWQEFKDNKGNVGFWVDQAKQILAGLDVYVKDPDQTLDYEALGSSQFAQDVKLGWNQCEEAHKKSNFIKVIHISKIIKEVEK